MRDYYCFFSYLDVSRLGLKVLLNQSNIFIHLTDDIIHLTTNLRNKEIEDHSFARSMSTRNNPFFDGDDAT